MWKTFKEEEEVASESRVWKAGQSSKERVCEYIANGENSGRKHKGVTMLGELQKVDEGI